MNNKTNNNAQKTLSDIIYERDKEITGLRNYISHLESRDSLNGSYFRMGLVVGLAVAVFSVWLTYEIMS